MALNPIVFTEKIADSLRRCQLAAHSFADERLLRRMRGLLSLDEAWRSPLLAGRYVSVWRCSGCALRCRWRATAAPALASETTSK